MAVPTFKDAQVGPASISFATRVAVQVDFGTSGNAGVIVQGVAYGFNTAISSMSVGGTMSGGTTTGTVGVAGTTNIDGTISGGTALTMETQASSTQLGTGNVRAGRGSGITLTGVQWVQMVCGDNNAKPSLTVATYNDAPTIAAGAAISYLGTALSQTLTTTTNDVAAALMYLDAGNASTLTVTSPAVQRLRGASANTSGLQSLAWETAGVAGTATIAGTSGSTQGWQGTKWAITGTTPSGFAAGPTADDATVGGTFSSGNSAMGAGPTADDASVGGSFSRVPGAFSFGPLKRNDTTGVTSVPLTWITFLAGATGAAVLTRTDVSINGSGYIAGSDVALVPGQAYQATWRESGGQYGSYQFTAA